MNAERLLALYDRVADAPDAVPRLRRFVLDLAVRGRLVEQDPADEPASELLKRIAAEKARLVKAGEIRKRKTLPPVEEPPFDIPENWSWRPIREITSDRGQKVPDATLTYIDVTAIDKENGIVVDPKILEPSEAPSRARKITRKDDVIYSCVRPYLLNVAVIEQDFDPSPIASTAFAILNGHGFVLPRYLWIVLRSPFMVATVEDNQRGQAYPAINDSDFAILPFPLPPLAEQHRIVAKVDELMALCDRLEAARAAREERRDRLTAAGLARLNAPDPDAATFRAHARFAVDALPALTARVDRIASLRQTILNLAVRGKLVEQNPADEPASELLKRIAAEKARLVKAGEIRKRKTLPPVEEPPFDIPENWSWRPIREITSDRGQKVPDATLTYIDVTAIDKENGIVVDPKILEPSEAPSRARKITRKDDVIYSCVRPYLLNVAVIEQDFDPSPIASTAFAILNGHGFVLPRYLWIVLRSPFMVATVEDNQRGQAYPAINDSDFAILPFPLPPLAEQHRIVAKVDELMALCDRLEAGLVAADTTRQRLLESLLHEALDEAA